MAETSRIRQHSPRSVGLLTMIFCCLAAGTATPVQAWPDDPCVVADDGTGTATLPPPFCAYQSPDGVFQIIDGLPPGTTIELEPLWSTFICPVLGCGVPGGALGGEVEDFDAELIFRLTGTGDLAGYDRLLLIPSTAQTHTGPRNPGDPVQSFPTELFSLVGALPPGDPDFISLQIVAGTGFGLPSPGQTTLTRLGPPGSDFQVDSFFDISYQISFVGAPGGVLDGLAGTTTLVDPVRMRATGERDPCIEIDDGTGTVVMPPPTCDYLSPQEAFLIIDGLPPGTQIELDPRHTNFVCDDPSDCGQPGGSLGGEVETFTSTLVLQLSRQGGQSFRRTLRVPASVVTHSGPRTPGDPVQSFPTDLFSLLGALPPGDPDFASLAITAGTGNALPSPGHTTLQQLPSGDFQVDSFFDITYQIDFVGAPGGALDGLSGTTTSTIRVDARPGKTDSVEEDNGLGTATLPPEGGEYVSPDETFLIIDGLPPGTTMELEASHKSFFCDTTPCSVAGGGLGGGTEAFDSTLELELRGTGSLTGFQRNLQVPLTVQTDSGPVVPGPVQEIDTELVHLQGSLLGDPDFDELTITAGSANGLPSPGHATLTDQGGDTFMIDSFFDIDYRIDFVGAPGGQLDGLSGSTTGEIRLTACDREDPEAPAHSIKIVKEATPEGATLFPFTGLSSFFLVDDGAAPNWRLFNNLSAGLHTVTETLAGVWSHTSIVCVDPDSGTTVNVPAGEAAIDLDLGEAITCTFGNSCIDDLVLANTTLTGTQAFKAANTATLGPGLLIDGTWIEVAARNAVILLSGTEIEDHFFAGLDAGLTCP